MYTQQDMRKARATWHRYLWGTGIGLLCLAAVCAVFCVFRLYWPGYIVLSLGACGIYFTWDLIGKPSNAYYSFLEAMAQGLQNEVSGVFSDRTQPAVQDGVPCTRYDFWTEGDPEQVRYVYLDNRKELPDAVQQQTVRLELYGNIIKAVKEV